MLGESPVMADEKEPMPVPLLVLVDKDTVGDKLVDHTTPLVVTAAPPSAVIFPPEVADVIVIELADIVLTVGRTTGMLVVNVISFPYPVPALLVAKALT